MVNGGGVRFFPFLVYLIEINIKYSNFLFDAQLFN